MTLRYVVLCLAFTVCVLGTRPVLAEESDSDSGDNGQTDTEPGDDAGDDTAEGEGASDDSGEPDGGADADGDAADAEVDASAEESAGTEAPVDDSSSLKRSGRMDFDARLVKGQAAKSGAVYLFKRVPRNLPGLVPLRISYRSRIVRPVLGNVNMKPIKQSDEGRDKEKAANNEAEKEPTASETASKADASSDADDQVETKQTKKRKKRKKRKSRKERNGGSE